MDDLQSALESTNWKLRDAKANTGDVSTAMGYSKDFCSGFIYGLTWAAETLESISKAGLRQYTLKNSAFTVEMHRGGVDNLGIRIYTNEDIPKHCSLVKMLDFRGNGAEETENITRHLNRIGYYKN